MNSPTDCVPIVPAADGSMSFAPCVDRIQSSISSAASRRARELAAAGRSIINLAVGEPDFDTPDNIKEAAIASIKRGDTKYTTVDGTPQLKLAISRKFERENGLRYATDQISVANGAKQIIFNAMVATLRESDEVIIPAPYWVSYTEAVKFCGATPKYVDCTAASGFKLQPNDLAAAIGPRTRWLILNSPSNPSGAAYRRDELVELATILKRHPQVWLLSDDIYEHLLYDNVDFCSPATIDQEIYRRTLTVNGVSKAYCMTGWRIGYAGGPASLINAMATIQSQATSNPSSISQAAALEALSGPQEGLAERALEFQMRRDFLLEKLENIAGLECQRPQGAFYAFPSCRDLIGKVTREGKALNSDRDIAQYLLESSGVAVVYGAAYGLSPFLRISYTTSQEQLAEACARINDACLRLS